MSTTSPILQRKKATLPHSPVVPGKIGDLIWQYGFRTLEHIRAVHHSPAKQVATVARAHVSRDHRFYPALLRDSQLPACANESLLPSDDEGQLMIFSTRGGRTWGETRPMRLSLEIFGVSGALAEALLLKSAASVLRESGVSHLYVRVNSLGDHDSTTRFLRECNAYFSRRRNDLHPSCKEAIRRNIIRVFRCRHLTCRELCLDAPRPITFLSEQSRVHLKEVLEHLETLGISYELDDDLLPDDAPSFRTIFEISTRDKDEKASVRHAFGGRYGDYARSLGLRKEIPAAGIAISMNHCGNIFAAPPGPTKVKVYFIPIGTEARRKSLTLLDTLRDARVSAHLPLVPHSLNAELRHADDLRIPYVLIMGHKEAVEGTVIVRVTETRVQEIVPLSDLLRHFKKIGLS